MTHNPTPEDASHEDLGLSLVDDVAAESPASRRGPARWLFVVAGLVLIVLIVVGVSSLNRVSAPATVAAETVAQQVISASDVRKLEAASTEQAGTFRVDVSASQDAYAVQLDGFPEAPEGLEYQLSISDRRDNFVQVALLGAKPDGKWSGYRGAKDVTALHLTVVDEGGEAAPSRDDVATIEMN